MSHRGDEASAELKTILEIEKENEIKDMKLVDNLTNALNRIDKQCEEIRKNISITETNLLKGMRQKEDMEKAYNEELQMMTKRQSEELKLVFREHERTKSKLKAEQEDLRLYEKALKEREYLNESEKRGMDYLKEKSEKVIIEQKKDEESMMKLAEAQKNRKNNLYQRIIELEKKLDDNQRLELEIEQMKGALEVMKQIGEDRDDILKIMTIKENLTEKEYELEHLEELNKSLIISERNANENLWDARNLLINALKPRSNAPIGIKRMGDLDEKLILAAVKKRYPAAEAAEKAMEFTLQLEAKLRDPSWYPFKVIYDGEGYKEVIDEEDDCLKTIKTELDDEAYKAVLTTITEMNEYNPSGRHPVPELWNFREGKRATLGDCVDKILKRWMRNQN